MCARVAAGTFVSSRANSAAGTIDRLLDVFPPIQQPQVRAQMSISLVGVCSQNLLRKVGGGRCACQEIMLNTPAIGNLIREGKTSQIYSAIQMGGRMGMQTMESGLAKLYQEGKITYEDALGKSSKPDELIRLVGGNPKAKR